MAAAGISEALILESVNDAIIVIDMCLHICVWNRAAEAIYGWRAEEVVGKPVDDMLHTIHYPQRTTPEDILRVLQQAGHWHGRVIQQHCDGHEIIIEGSARLLCNERGVSIGVVSINRDITEQVQMEEALRASEERFRSLVQNSTDVISVLDREGRICYINPAVEQYLGSPPEELIGKDAFEVVHPDDVPMVMDACSSGRTLTT
jgi:PAS domain S-box-containing protein